MSSEEQEFNLDCHNCQKRSPLPLNTHSPQIHRCQEAVFKSDSLLKQKVSWHLQLSVCLAPKLQSRPWHKLRRTSSYLALLYCASQMLHFLRIEGKTLPQQKDDHSLYFHTCFIVVIWN